MSPSDLADLVVEQLDRIGQPVRGRFAPARAIAEHEVQPTSAYLDRAHLETQIVRTVPPGDLNTVDRRVIASRFVREYCLGIVPPVLVGLGLGLGIDVVRSRSVWERWHLRGSSAVAPHALSADVDAFAVCAECHPSRGGASAVLPTHDDLRAWVWRRLFVEHLAPLFDVILQIEKLSVRVLWASAAEAAARVATFSAERLSADAARPFIAECDALLGAERLPGTSEPNPLRGQAYWKDIGRTDFPHGLMLRSVCCMCFTLPDRRGQVYCGTCPLPPVETLIAIMGRPPADPGAARIGAPQYGRHGR
jgi:hypothetical protein